MTKLLKCFGYCNKKYPREELFDFKINPNSKTSKRMCRKCFLAKTKETNDRNELYWFIQETYNITFPTGQMLRQIKNFVEVNNYTYKNIHFTLNYIFNIKRAYKPEVKYGISLVPYFYDEMLYYYKDLKEKRENMKDVDLTPKIVKVAPMRKTSSEDYKNSKIINLEELINE